MSRCTGVVLSGVGLLGLWLATTSHLAACCAVPRSGQPVVNADQTVVIVWDPARKRQHFIRQASFQSQGDDFAFLIPTPTQPELEESGNEAFPLLRRLTEPGIQRVSRRTQGGGCGCGSTPIAPGSFPAEDQVAVIEEKQLAGFDAVVLEAASGEALVEWLREHDYEFSPAAQTWAQPYIDSGWMITALRVSKSEAGQSDRRVDAAALRLSFQTDRPLFPYREPDSGASAEALGAKHRLLRIYFLSDARYVGRTTPEDPWSGQVAWSDKVLPKDRSQLLEHLNLPHDTGPDEWWLTEFEDHWRYRVAPADVYFSKAGDQSPVKRSPIIQYVSRTAPIDLSACAWGVLLLAGPAWRRARRRRRLVS
ncbi:MAG: DUF2330 domain-containing protein [Planctomycetales bacterium]